MGGAINHSFTSVHFVKCILIFLAVQSHAHIRLITPVYGIAQHLPMISDRLADTCICLRD